MAAPAAMAAQAAPRQAHPAVQVIRRIVRQRTAVVGFGILVALVAVALLAPVLSPHPPDQQHLDARLAPGFWAGNTAFPLGQDHLGRDVLSRLLYGARLSLRIGVIAVTIGGLTGLILGLTSGYFGSWAEMAIMRITDIMMAVPDILLAMALVFVLGANMTTTMVAVGIVYVPKVARVVRGSVLVVRQQTYVEAARATGAGSGRIIWRHITPNILGPFVVYLSLLLGDAVLYGAALGFLGLGAQPPLSEWGTMLSEGREYLLLGQWWLVAFPGVMIALTVLSLNLFGDGLRDALDPTMKK